MSMKEGALIAVRDCMNVRPNETVLVVTDEVKRDVGRAIYDAADLASEAFLLTMKPRETDGQEPPEPVALAMKSVDVVLAPTDKSITHTKAREQACSVGARVATLPGVTSEMMAEGGMQADYGWVEEKANSLYDKLNGSKKARITSEEGTDLSFDLEGRKWNRDTGICKNPGESTNLPGGEVYISPASAEGKLVIDGSVSGLGLLDSPLTVEIEDGYGVSFHGERADEFEEILRNAGKPGRNVAELGIGINPAASLIGVTLEDEKVAGTLHVAFGDDSTIGGQNEASVHLDGLITSNPTLQVDGTDIEL